MNNVTIVVVTGFVNNNSVFCSNYTCALTMDIKHHFDLNDKTQNYTKYNKILNFNLFLSNQTTG